MERLGLNLVPFQHEELDDWRENFKGVQYFDEDKNLIITGAVDDVWFNLNTDELIVVDYKATAKNGEVSLDADWQDGYRRQMDIYQWLLRKMVLKSLMTATLFTVMVISQKSLFLTRLSLRFLFSNIQEAQTGLRKL